MRKRVLSILLAAAFILSLIPEGGTAAAAGETTQTGNGARVVVEEAWANPGGTVAVDISIEDNPGIKGAILTVSWAEGMTPISDAGGSAFPELEYFPPSRYIHTGTNFIWYGNEAGNAADGTILTLTFQVSETAENNELFNIEVSYVEGDIFDDDDKNVALVIDNGYVRAITYTPGDVNNDGKVNTRDLVRLSQYISDGCVTNPDGYNAVVVEDACDVTGDGRVNTRDLVRLSQYISDGCETVPEGYNASLLPAKLPDCSHTMESIAFKAATCEEDGNVGYYHCTACDKYYNDSNGTKEITQASTVLPKKGHTAVTDPYVAPGYDSHGWTEGSHCGVCFKTLVAQTEIPPLEKSTVTINYHYEGKGENSIYLKKYIEDNNVASFNTNKEEYNTAEKGYKLDPMRNDAIPGFDFIGWEDGYGNPVTSIAKGDEYHLELYAQWQIQTYWVKFTSPDVPAKGVTGFDPAHPEIPPYSVPYTVATGLNLNNYNPSCYGYTFVGWSDSNGFLMSEVKPGTTGNITVQANWTSERNRATSYRSYGEPIIIEDVENGQFLFVYNIGRIDKVPLNELREHFSVQAKYEFSEKIEITDSVGSGYSNSINKMVSDATTRSSGWTLSKEWNDTYTKGEGTGELSERSEERETSSGTVVGGKYFVSNSKGGSSYVSTESGGSYSNSTKITTDESFGINASYDTATEKYCDAQLNINTHNGVTNETESGLGIEIPLSFGDFSAGLKNTTTIESSLDTGVNIQSGRKDKTAFHIDGSYSEAVGTVDESNYDFNYRSAQSNTTNWNSENGYEKSNELTTNEKVVDEIKKQISATTTHSISKALGGANSTTTAVEDSSMTSEEYATSLTYDQSKSTTYEETVTQTFDVPGHYRYITAGTVHVYGVVGYDVATASFYTYCFNVLDDKTYQDWDYSKDFATFDDCENGVVTFNVPYEVNKYIAGVVGTTKGLEIDYEGSVNDFVPTEDFDGTVVIPKYVSKDNLDNKTYSAVKVNSISSTLFANAREKIEIVVLPEYITKIPDNAFAGCTNLKTVIAYGVTEIGDNAFAGCGKLNTFCVDTAVTSLGENAFEGVPEVEIAAYDSSVASAAINCGAQKITLNIAHIKDSFEDKVVDVPASTAYFALIGNGGEYNNVSVISAAGETMINNMVFANNTDVPVRISSPKVTLARMTVKDAPGFALKLEGDDVQLKLLGNINLSSSSEHAVISKSVTLSKADSGTTSKLVLDGNYLAYGDITNADMVTQGKIIYLDKDRYGVDLKLTFDPNGGMLIPGEGEEEISEKAITIGSLYGDLPTPTCVGYVFGGWYTTAAEDGVLITPETRVSVVEDQTLYAHWNPLAYTITWDDAANYTVSVTRTSSPHSNAAGELNNGDPVYYGDVLSVVYTANEGYSISSNGSTEITVSGDVTASDIYATVEPLAYTVSWQAGANYSVAVERTASPNANAAAGKLSSGDVIYYGDVLRVVYTANTGYYIANSGSTEITVAGDVTSAEISASVAISCYPINWKTGTGYSIAVSRTSSPLQGASTGSLKQNDTVYYGDILNITYTAAAGYNISKKGSTSITVTGPVTSSDIFVEVAANNIPYKIVYKSSNGTSLGTDTVTHKYGTTNTVSPKSFSGYKSPSSQSVVWDSTSAKTITFTYTPIPVESTTKSGVVFNEDNAELGYSAVVEHQNRTATSVQLRVTCTSYLKPTGSSGVYNVYGQCFSASAGSVPTGDITITSAGTWKDSSTATRSATKSSGWITVPLTTTNATSVDLSFYYYQVNYNGTKKGSDASATWSISVPAY